MNKEQIQEKLQEIEKGMQQAVDYIEQFKNSHAQLVGQRAALVWALQELENSQKAVEQPKEEKNENIQEHE